MNPNQNATKNGQFSFIYISMTLGLILVAFTYFFSVLQPRLHQESQQHAAMFINSASQDLLQRKVIEDAFLLQREISKVLLYTDETTQQPYIEGLRIEFNPDLFPHHSRPLQRGKTQCKHCFEVSKQVYCNSTNELIANINFLVSPVNYQRMINEIAQKFFLFLALLLFMLSIIWLATRRLFNAHIATQQALSQANEYNQKMINTLQDWLLVVDEKGTIINANQTASQQLRIQINPDTAFYLQHLVTLEKNQQPLMSLIQQTAADTQQPLVEVKYGNSPKNQRYGLLSYARFIDPVNTQHIHYLIVIKDVQALKIAESKLAYQAQMAHASRLKSLGEMAAGIAHEINQPLAVIRLGAEGIKHSMQHHMPDAFEIEVADDMIAQVDRASQIINNMRAFSRQKSTEKLWISTHTPLNTALSFFREEFRLSGIELIERIDENCPEVELETQKFEQVLINLLTNARQALEKLSPLRPIIEIQLQCDQQQVYVSIKDNGCGMDETTKQHCRDPFFTTKDAGEGTGLGLSIVDNILNELNINLTIESELTKGSTFTLKIPHRLAGKNHDQTIAG
jgi:C4-dicarboxylate-specific signal transduction histidine kinase